MALKKITMKILSKVVNKYNQNQKSMFCLLGLVRWWCWWNALLQRLQVVGVDGVVVRAGVLHPILKVVGGVAAWKLHTRAAAGWHGCCSLLRVPRGQRGEVLRDPRLVRISDGQSCHAAVTHPQHNRSRQWKIYFVTVKIFLYNIYHLPSPVVSIPLRSACTLKLAIIVPSLRRNARMVFLPLW